MASVNPLSRELVFKIVYYGPGLGGKTTTLEHIHATAKPEHRGKLVSLATPVDRTLYFDFLPIQFDTASGFSVKLKLFTVPGQVMHKATRKVVLSGADAARLGLDWRRGPRGNMQTANGATTGYFVKLDRVRVGGIELRNIDAVVVEQGLGSFGLLGMSFLNRVEMRRDGEKMELIRRF